MRDRIITCGCGAHAKVTVDEKGLPSLPDGWQGITVTGLPIRNAVLCGDCTAQVLGIIDGEPRSVA